jgi:hypothetical protein
VCAWFTAVVAQIANPDSGEQSPPTAAVSTPLRNTSRILPIPKLGDTNIVCNNATVAFCMIGTNFPHYYRFGIQNNMLKHVLRGLGGPQNVEVFVNYFDVDSFPKTTPKWMSELRLLFRNVRTLAVKREKIASLEPCPQDRLPFRTGGWMTFFRLRDCTQRITEFEQICGKR